MIQIRTMAIAAVTAVALPAFASANHSFSTVYQFAGDADGLSATSGLTNAGGYLYGATKQGGTNGVGTLYRFDPVSNSKTTIYNFKLSNDGNQPYAGLTYFNGVLYGTTLTGGNVGWGTAYAFDPTTGAEKVLYSLGDKIETPSSRLTIYDGYLYGTDVGMPWDQAGSGNVFKISLTDDSYSSVHFFNGGTDGASSYGRVIMIKGKLYGTTNSAGAFGAGTVFRMDPVSGLETVIHNFTGGSDGGYPAAGLTYSNGNLYGTTAAGGIGGYGTVFKIDMATGTEAVLYSFAGGTDGANPSSDDLLYLSGKLYGTTVTGGSIQGSPGYGTVFAIDATSGAETVLHRFAGGQGGQDPRGGLLYYGHFLYGTTYGAGTPGSYGTIYKLLP